MSRLIARVHRDEMPRGILAREDVWRLASGKCIARPEYTRVLHASSLERTHGRIL